MSWRKESTSMDLWIWRFWRKSVWRNGLRSIAICSSTLLIESS